jgi:hypothetical protein
MAKNAETQKIVWVDKDIHHILSVESARNSQRVGRFINHLLREWLEKNEVKP